MKCAAQAHSQNDNKYVTERTEKMGGKNCFFSHKLLSIGEQEKKKEKKKYGEEHSFQPRGRKLLRKVLCYFTNKEVGRSNTFCVRERKKGGK